MPEGRAGVAAAAQVAWHGPAYDPSGYGEVTRRMVRELSQCHDVDIRLHPTLYWKGRPLELDAQTSSALGEASANELGADAPVIRVQNLPPEHFCRTGARYDIAMLAFETDRLPPDWPDELNRVDEVWTYSRWGADVFRASGVRRPITVVPHGVDADVYGPDGDTLVSLEAQKAGRFLFGSVFEWSARKNPEALVGAYLREFHADEPVALALKTYHQFPVSQGAAFVARQVARLAETVRRTGHRPGRLILLTDLLAQADMPRFYRSLDAYVLPARGEGWGLTFSEAMATGLPTIGVGWSGNTEFMNDDNSLLLRDYRLVTVQDSDVGKRKIYVGHRWADCDVDELRAAMRRVYEDAAFRRRIGERARRDMAGRFTWRAAAAIARRRLREINEHITPALRAASAAF